MDRLSPSQRRDLILSVGTHQSQRPLSPTEVADFIEVRIDSGEKLGDIARDLGLTSTMLGRLLRLRDLDPDLRHLVDWNRGQATISPTSGSEIAKLRNFDDQRLVVEAILTRALSKEEVRQVIQISQRSGADVKQATEAVLKLRPEKVVQHLVIGAVMSPSLQIALGEMTQHNRDALFTSAIASCFPDLPSWSGHLSSTRFTMIGDENFGAAIKKLPDGFEQAISTCLEAQAQHEE